MDIVYSKGETGASRIRNTRTNNFPRILCRFDSKRGNALISHETADLLALQPVLQCKMSGQMPRLPSVSISLFGFASALTTDTECGALTNKKNKAFASKRPC